MRCFEIELKWQLPVRENLINFNMRCFEMYILVTAVCFALQINFNMRCFEIIMNYQKYYKATDKL